MKSSERIPLGDACAAPVVAWIKQPDFDKKG